MIRTSKILAFIITSCMTLICSSSAFAQSHGISKDRFLSPEKSMKSIQPQALGLSNDLSQHDNKAAVAGLANQGHGKSLSFRNGFGLKSSQAGIGELQPLKDKETASRHVGEEHWETAFDGIEVKSGPTKGKLITGKSLQGGSSLKGVLFEQSSHGLAGDGWSQLKKDTEGLK